MEIELHPRNVVFATLSLLALGFLFGYGVSGMVRDGLAPTPVVALLAALVGLAMVLKNGGAEAFGRRTKYWND